jgi:hypothetical protein
MKITIIGHPGNPAHADKDKVKAGKHSGVQTSKGDKFHGDVVDLPKDEAGLLIAAKRAEEFDAKEAEAKDKK